jgi:DNA-binding NarL/FixJ family response regulator
MQHTVVVVDDHLLIARALTGIIDKFSNYRVLYEAEHGKILVEKFTNPVNIPDIVLLDIKMPVMDGFETAKWLSKNHPDIHILALSMQDEDETLVKMIRCGAGGYLLKNIHPLELEKSLDMLVAKGFYYPDWVTRKMLLNISREEGQEKPGKSLINDRETEFLQFAATELTYKEIATKMFCSPRTVESYRDSLFEKLHIKTRVGLVLYAIKNKIVVIG